MTRKIMPFYNAQHLFYSVEPFRHFRNVIFHETGKRYGSDIIVLLDDDDHLVNIYIDIVYRHLACQPDDSMF